MKVQKKSGTKIPGSPDKKRSAGVSGRFDRTFFRKNEFALILLGALLLTLIVFFVFFRSSGPVSEPVPENTGTSSFDALEKRLEALEKSLELKTAHADGGIDKKVSAEIIGPLDDRITRLETAFLVKFESLIERMENLEKKIAAVKDIRAAPKKTVVSGAKKTATPVKKPVVKTAKKAALFHTVEKGETLYSISKKYKTSVTALRKLNNLSEKDKIYPGNNIMIR